MGFNVLIRPRKKQTILLAEDDDDVRQLVSAALRAEGFHVVARGNGLLALHAFQHLGHIDLLFSDLHMPAMSGQELALAVAAQRPGIAIILASGTAPGGGLHSLIVRAGWRFLPKPFGEREMLHAVHQELAGQGRVLSARSRHLA